MAFLKSWNTGDQVLATDLNGNFTALKYARVFDAATAGEALAVTDACCLGAFQSDSGILNDTKASNSATASGGVVTATSPITIAANSNRIITVVVTCAASAPNCTWNGVSLTLSDRLQQASSGSWVHTFYLVAPATGANNLVISNLNTTETIRYFIYSYYNASQSTINGHTISAGTVSVSASVTPTVDGCLIFGFTFNMDAGLTSTSGIANNSLTPASGYQSGDSGQIFPPTSQTVNGQGITANRIVSATICIAPFTTPVYRIFKASSLSLTSFRFIFLGFPNASATSGGTVDLNVFGIINALSGLTPLAAYYLNDTNGTYGKSAGTNIKKIGVAISTTQLLLTNNF